MPWLTVEHELPKWWLREQNMIVGCVNNKTHGSCGFFGYWSTESSFGDEKGAGKLKRALKRAPEQFDVWKTSLTE